MMAPVPLRSAMETVRADDTSLALPSDDKLRTGQQRVLDQVHTIKRSKSKHGTSKSPASSPTGLSPQSSTTYTEFGTFKFVPSKTNGTFSRTNSTMSTGYNKVMNSQKSRTLSAKTMGGRHFSNSATLDHHIGTSKLTQRPNGLKTSRSDPILVPPVPASASAMGAKGQTIQNQQTFQTRVNRHSTYSVTNGTQMTNSQTRMVRPPSDHIDGKMGTMKISKADMQQLAVNSAASMTDMTIKDAVDLLAHPEEIYQQHGASFIQSTTYNNEGSKKEVYELGGIPLLVCLLRSSNPDVSQAAAKALRNLVFNNLDNKLQVQDCDGIAKSLQLLKETDSTETQKQVTGLLWNLSSADQLKKEMSATALPALTEYVLVPFTSWSENTNNNNVHPESFCNATACLRNLSSSKDRERKAMRDCRGLIDSLMSYVQSCVAEENPDDKSVENCVCILHNLTFQLDSESPECFRNVFPGSESESGKKSPTIGCFSPRSSKVQKEFLFDANKVMDSAPSGANWLCHPKAMQTYLSLMGTSQNDSTLEACCGALQNITASKGPWSSVISQILIRNQGALMYMPSLLRSTNSSLQKTAMSLVNNLSRNSGLQTPMAKQILPELTSLLSSGPSKMGNSDETIASVCNTALPLILTDTEFTKKFVQNEMVSSLADLSENRALPKSSAAASLLLYRLWNDRNLQGVLKKMGYSKAFFINENTSGQAKSFQ